MNNFSKEKNHHLETKIHGEKTTPIRLGETHGPGNSSTFGGGHRHLLSLGCNGKFRIRVALNKNPFHKGMPGIKNNESTKKKMQEKFGILNI